MSGPRPKLNAEQIRVARERATAGELQKVIAIDLGVSEATVSNAIAGARAYRLVEVVS